MVSRQQIQESLQQRVDNYLSGNPLAYVVEGPTEEAIEAIFSLLQKAEEDLKATQERVDRLQLELAKVQSYFAHEAQRPLI
jgi:hypothetical protein